MGAEAWGLAFLAGSVGTLLGGTQVFIIYGFLGILVAVMGALGMDVAYLNDKLVNLFFMPCVIFNGAGFATAYAAAKHNIKGYEVGRSLAFTNDPKVLLTGGIGGVLGYTIYVIATGLRVPRDIGSLSVVIMGIAGRLLFYKGPFYNKKALLFFSGGHYKDLLYPVLMALIISCSMACFAKDTGLYTIGFSISAMSLIFAFTDPAFPFTMVFNSKCGTHIDPPGVAMESAV